MRSRWPLWALLLCASLTLTSPARASVFDVFGMTARGSAMGGALGATVADHAAIYYNPAGLTRRKKVHFGLTAQVFAPLLDIKQALDTTRDAVLPQTNLAVTLGVVFPLAGKLDDRIALGVAIYLPVLNVTRFEAIDPATPQFYLYQSLPDALVIAAGLGVQITDWLSIGVGAQVLAAFEGKLELDLNLANRRVEHREITGEIFGDIGPVVGLQLGPFEGFSFGFTYRNDFSLAFELPIDLRIDGVGLLAIDARGTGLYTPDQFNFGFAYAIPTFPLLIAADVTWVRWSLAPKPAIEIDTVLDDTGLDSDAAEPGEVLNLETLNPDLGAQDILIPRVGLEYRHSELWALQAGYFYRPSPIPDQTGYTNYADAAAHTVSLGGSLSWEDPLEVHKNPMSVDLFVQATILEDRPAIKDFAQDIERVGSWTASGTIWNIGVEWRHDF